MMGKLDFAAVVVSGMALLVGANSSASIPKTDAREGAAGRAAVVVVTDQATGQSCLVDTDNYAVHALRVRGQAPIASSVSDAMARSGGQLPVCSAEVNSWASESSKVAYVDGGPQVAMAAAYMEQVLALGVLGMAAYTGGAYLGCSAIDVSSTMSGEMVRNNEGNPKRTTGRAPLAAARLWSWVGGVVGYTVCIPVTGVNWVLSWVLVN